MFVCIPVTQGYKYECIEQCPACRHYQNDTGLVYKRGPYYNLPDIPREVEYTPWQCVHGHTHIMITITETCIYETTDYSTGRVERSVGRFTVCLW